MHIIHTDGNNNLYVADYYYQKGDVTEYKAGSKNVLRRLEKGIANPIYLAVDGKDNVYVANDYPAITVVEYPATGSKPERSLNFDKSSDSEIYGIAASKGGTLFVTAPDGDAGIEELGAHSTKPIRKITSIDPAGAITFGPGSFYSNGSAQSQAGVFEFASNGTKPIASANVCFSGFGVPGSLATDEERNAFVLTCKQHSVTEFAKARLQTLRTFNLGKETAAAIGVK